MQETWHVLGCNPADALSSLAELSVRAVGAAACNTAGRLQSQQRD